MRGRGCRFILDCSRGGCCGVLGDTSRWNRRLVRRRARPHLARGRRASVGSSEGTPTSDAEVVGQPWSPVGSPGVATAPMPTPAWERLEEERWDGTLVSNYVRNGRYSPTRPLWRPPRPPTPHRAMPSSDEEYGDPIVIVDSEEEEAQAQNETRQTSLPDAGAEQWRKLRREEWPLESRGRAARHPVGGPGKWAHRPYHLVKWREVLSEAGTYRL
ncbi:hypothetical protein AWZ03_015192 [Drosophila navojoa]|uniref:Uncharacterized protein n=1 Tax=Drosophila navojoa TaxID=7232 RepID=A0A484AP36_DRONA|nr:hypothetical protein AWZ03_015192 [Drosophila navojoa]